MAVSIKILASNTALTSAVAGFTTDISPITSSTKGWLIKNIFFYNPTSGQTLTIDLKIKQGSIYRMLAKGISLPGGTSPVVLERDITLDLNRPDVLAAVLTSTSGTLHGQIVVNGIERDQ